MAVQISGNDITVPRDTTVTRNLTVGGVLTYEDVTNVDSVGLVTARSGIEIGARPGVAASISVDGNMIVSGISTFGGDVQVPDKIVHTGDTNTALRFPAADTITAETGGSERLRIDSSGKVNIGNTGSSWVGPLSIGSGASGVAQVLQLYSNSDTYGAIFFGDADSGAGRYVGDISYYHDNNYMRFSTGGSERVRITSAGLVGVGTISPDRQLHVLASNGTVAHFESDNANTISQIVFQGKDISTPPNLGATGEDLHFTTNNLERLRIESNGQLNIGGTAAGPTNSKLYVAGTNSTNYLTFRNTSASDSDGGRWNNIRFQGTQSGGEVSDLVHLQGNHHGSSDDEKGAFEVLINDGNDGSSPNKRIRVDSDGLKFNSDTAADNALNDYEEGTFTPTVAQGGSVSSYTLARGSYTKIGDFVHCQIDLYINGTGDGNGVRFGGLPFTSVNQATLAFGGAYLSYSNAVFPRGSSDRALFHVISQSTQVAVYNEAGAALAGNSSGMDVFSNREFLLQVQYKAS